MVDKMILGESLPIAFRFSAVILRHTTTDITAVLGLFQEQADLISQYQGSQSYHTCTTKIEYICVAFLMIIMLCLGYNFI